MTTRLGLRGGDRHPRVRPLLGMDEEQIEEIERSHWRGVVG
jgi:hypothetical protein